LPDDATAEQIAKLPAASWRTTEPELKNLKVAIWWTHQDGEPVCVPQDLLN
jgi:hypothetical protein